MREIKFRGMTVNGHWHIGNVSFLKQKVNHVEAGTYISNSVGLPFAYQVRPETVGEFTGLHDKNGKEIFEGDIVSWGGSMYGFGKVVYERYSFLVKYKLGENEDEMYFNHPDAYTVIGNIYESQELLKGEGAV